MKRLLAMCVAFPILFSPALVSAAPGSEEFPARPIRLVTAFNGGISDTVAHTLSDALGAELGRPVVVTAQSGAGGNIGVQAVAKAAADGHTLLLGGGWLFTNALLQPTDYNDPDTNLTAVAPIISVPYVWVAHPKCGCRNLQDLAQRVRSAKVPTPYGTPGIGTPPHLLIEQFARSVGREALHVPYRGGGPQIVALLGGEIDFSLVSITTALPHIQRGDLTPLAVTSRTRSALLPEVATVREQGFANQEVSTWFGLFGPAKLPNERVRRIADAAKTALQGQKLRTAYEKLGAEAFSPQAIDDFSSLLRDERERWQAAVRLMPATP